MVMPKYSGAPDWTGIPLSNSSPEPRGTYRFSAMRSVPRTSYPYGLYRGRAGNRWGGIKKAKGGAGEGGVGGKARGAGAPPLGDLLGVFGEVAQAFAGLGERFAELVVGHADAIVLAFDIRAELVRAGAED